MTILLACLLSLSLPPLPSRPAVAVVDFDRDVRPLLSDRCFACHGPDASARRGELRLDTPDGMATVIDLVRPEDSLLLERVTTPDPDDRMPPPGHGEPLDAAERLLLERWIAAGAVWRGHWAFEPPATITPPDAAARNPIDAFVQATLVDAGFAPAPREDEARLLRRVHLDLTGLPPTPAEIDTHLAAAATDPRAFEHAVDRLLASPAYGERMAWDWLDLARYADTNGFQNDPTRTQWPWRDWVVRAFNANLPFDEFTRRQIAGDLIETDDRSSLLASAFLRNHMINGEGGRIAAENVVEYAFDMTETVGTAWLGLTLNCARCHDHKFDPIPQREYYAFLDFFHQSPHDGSGGDPHTPPVMDVAIDGMDTPVRVMVMGDRPDRRPTHVLTRGNYRTPGETVLAGTPSILPSLEIPSDRIPTRLDLADWLVDPRNPLTARVFVNREWRRFFGRGLVETVEDFGTQGDRPTHPALLDWLATTFIEDGWDVKALHRRIVTSDTYAQSARRRTELDDLDPGNHLLGRGPRQRMPAWMIRDHALACSGLLVDRVGGPPVKPYQPEGLWSETTFGTIVYEPDHGDALHRRSLYTFWRRIIGPPIFFDNADRRTCSVRTAITNTPMHALTTLNDPTFVEAARAMAERVLTAEEHADDIAVAFRIATGRQLDADERAILDARLDALRAHYLDSTDDARDLLAIGESPRDESLDVTEHAAWTGLCLMLLNLDESLTK
jgi:hypothetical protein